MKRERLKTIGLVILLLTLSAPFLVLGTVEYAEKTEKECAACHTDPSGGGDLTAEGTVYAKELEAKGLIKAPTSNGRLWRIIVGYLHMMTAFIWFGAILYIHIFLKPAYVSKGIPKGELMLGWVSMLIMLVTGIILTINRLPSFSALFHTRFGILLLIKLGLFLFMMLTVFFVTFVVARKLEKKEPGAVDTDKTDLTLAELARFDGQDGRPAYIVLDGTIYDVTGSRLWEKGNHVRKHMAGADLTTALKQAPHGARLVTAKPVVGKLVESKVTVKKPFHIKVFYFLAYSMLVVVFAMIFIISMWKW